MYLESVNNITLMKKMKNKLKDFAKELKKTLCRCYDYKDYCFWCKKIDNLYKKYSKDNHSSQALRAIKEEGFQPLNEFLKEVEDTSKKDNSPQKELENGGNFIASAKSRTFEPVADRQCVPARNLKSKGMSEINKLNTLLTGEEKVTDEADRRHQNIAVETNSSGTEDTKEDLCECGQFEWEHPVSPDKDYKPFKGCQKFKPQKSSGKYNWAVYCATTNNRIQCSEENCILFSICKIKKGCEINTCSKCGSGLKPIYEWGIVENKIIGDYCPVCSKKEVEE